MKIENKKLAKEFKNIVASSEKAKKVIVSELDKIDAKYKALAEKEKAELNDALKNLETMIAAYAPMLESEPASDEVVDDALPFDETVEDVVDEAEAEAEVVEAEKEDEPEVDGAGFTEEDNVKPEEELEDLPEDEEEKSEDSDDEWGSFPKEW